MELRTIYLHINVKWPDLTSSLNDKTDVFNNINYSDEEKDNMDNKNREEINGEDLYSLLNNQKLDK